MIMDQMQLEQEKLKTIIREIDKNIADYQLEKEAIDADTQNLYDAYMEGNTEVYSELMVSLSLQEHITDTLNRNRNVRSKPYFGRVDYLDKEEMKPYSLYIGKHGINKDKTTILIVDWRAAAAGIYYECAMGDGEYHVEDGSAVPIHLDLKRTFDIEDSVLKGFFDSDTVANDELLIKYLSQNKDVVLGEIVATIQKEQNAIIREKPGRNIIVQGVAGSGKTTVAIHRISYLLYNFSDRYAPEEFCIIGSNKILLNYITSGLPDLDVHNTNQFRMDEFLLHLLDGKIPMKRYRQTDGVPVLMPLKSSLGFVKKLEDYLQRKIERMISRNEVREGGLVLFEESNINQCLTLYRNHSAYQKIAALSERLASRIALVTDGEEDRKKKEIKKKYRCYFRNQLKKQSVISVYTEFLLWLMEHGEEVCSNEQMGVLPTWIADVQKCRLDLYDLAALVLIHYRWSRTEDGSVLKQIIIDEAQDFGVMIYYVLHTVLSDAVFTVMGDVSQNIHYDTGMNDWKELRTCVFSDPKDCFHMLRKSYRNTIEISRYASHILDQATFETYPIDPIVRHGAPVNFCQCQGEKELAEEAVKILKEEKEKGFDTMAVICRDEEEARQVKKLLAAQLTFQGQNEEWNLAVSEDGEEETFRKGIQILPIYLTKGLEFDTVLLWNPNEDHYQKTDRDAKLLYVAVTRALHELHIIYTEKLCDLLMS
ncbi:MAG: HelD family protein [Lachnospiraceae bacterium]